MVPAIYYLLAAFLGTQLVRHAAAASVEYGRACAKLGMSESAAGALDSFWETLTFGMYSGGTARNLEVKSIFDAAAAQEAEAAHAAWLLALATAIYLGWRALGAWRRSRDLRPMLRDLLGVSVVFLLVGLLAPIFSLVARGDVPVLGHVVFKYESKGVLAAIGKLYEKGNGFIAALILLFSVLTPAAKLGISLFAVLGHRVERTDRALRFVKAIGKWSMADVFVVAVLLAIFSLDSDAYTDAWLGPGLYFFAGYCMASLVAGHVLAEAAESGGLEKPEPGMDASRPAWLRILDPALLRSLATLLVVLLVFGAVYTALPRWPRTLINRAANATGIRLTPWPDRAEAALRAMLRDPARREAIGKAVLDAVHSTGKLEAVEPWDLRREDGTVLLSMRLKWSGSFIGKDYATLVEWRCDKQGHVRVEVPMDVAAVRVKKEGTPELEVYFREVFWPELKRELGE